MYPVKANTPGLHLYFFRLLGADGAALTQEEPDKNPYSAITHARTGEGVYTITWGTNPGLFINAFPSFGAATMADVDDYKFARDTWPTTSPWTLTFTVYAVTTAADLIADQYLDLIVVFKQAGSGY